MFLCSDMLLNLTIGIQKLQKRKNVGGKQFGTKVVFVLFLNNQRYVVIHTKIITLSFQNGFLKNVDFS